MVTPVDHYQKSASLMFPKSDIDIVNVLLGQTSLTLLLSTSTDYVNIVIIVNILLGQTSLTLLLSIGTDYVNIVIIVNVLLGQTSLTLLLSTSTDYVNIVIIVNILLGQTHGGWHVHATCKPHTHDICHRCVCDCVTLKLR